MDSAVRFLWEHNFRDLTIGELMADTPLSRPAFYQYFKDLHERIESLLSEVEAVMHRTKHYRFTGTAGSVLQSLLRLEDAAR